MTHNSAAPAYNGPVHGPGAVSMSATTVPVKILVLAFKSVLHFTEVL